MLDRNDDRAVGHVAPVVTTPSRLFTWPITSCADRVDCRSCGRSAPLPQNCQSHSERKRLAVVCGHTVRFDIRKTPSILIALNAIDFVRLRGIRMHRILVVDDFTPWRELAREIIEAQPELKVIAQAKDGKEAVQLATELNPTLLCST